MTKHDLLVWASQERAEALRQLKLFGAVGVKALLQLPDGTTQEITAGVVEHQTRNAAAFEHLIAVLS
jgi:hypothetical protein